MNVLSIQSRVAYGHVGNASAVFTLQRLGHDVWPVDTTNLSNHLGYPIWRGRVVSPIEVANIVSGLTQLGVLARCDAILSGYLGEAGNATVVRDTVARVRALNPSAIYACDPVMGDDGALFVKPDIPRAIAELLLPAADIALPNAFELGHLTGANSDDLAAALNAADRLRTRMRPGGTVVVTGLRRRDGPPDRIEVLAVAEQEAWLAATPCLSVALNGTGDCFAALFLGHYLHDRRLGMSLSRSVSAIYAVVTATAAEGAKELRLVDAQDHLRQATPQFAAERVR